MKRSILKQVILLTGLLPLTISYIQAQDLNAAIQLTRSEQYDKSEALLQQLIQKEPANGKNYFFLGENYLLDYFADTISNSLTVAAKSAKEIYQKGVDANANDPLNYIGLAKVAFYLGDNKTADEMRAKAKSFLLPYKNLKKISPPATDYAFTLAKIAESYIKEGKVDTSKALPLVREAVKINNKDKEIFLIAGDLYMLVNDGSSAIKNYNLAQFADPNSPTANMKIGYVYVKGRALTSAIPFFEEAIKLNAEYAPAYRELGQLYSSAGRFDQSKEYFKKYLELTQGNIPAKTRYVNALFYAKEYDEVIKVVEEIFAVDKSRTYMNRIAGYSSFDKKNADYNKALLYMEQLFKTVAPERIIWKDYYYMARILLRKNQDYPKMVADLNNLELQLDREKTKLSTSTTAAEKAKYKVTVDDMTAKAAKLKSEVAKADVEIDRAFGEYNKVLNLKPQDKTLLNEMANNYYTYRRYDGAAKTWAKLIDPANEKVEDYMQIGKAYYNGEKYKTADSVFNVIVKKSANYLPAHLWIARTYFKMDPEAKLGLAKPKFEKVADVAKTDSIKNQVEIMEALQYLGYYHMTNGNFSKAKDYYNRMINLDPNSKDNKLKGLNGIGLVELTSLSGEKTNEGRLPYLSRAAEAYNKILAIDAANASAKNQLNYIREFEASIRKGINPNEIKGVIRNTAGQPIPYASVRVKNTAAENITNTKGEYKFEIPQGSDVLLVTAEGYKAKEIAITKTRIYNVVLEK